MTPDPQSVLLVLGAHNPVYSSPQKPALSLLTLP